MRKFYQNKLWRDKLIAQREAKGAIVHTIPLAHAEYKEEIAMKFLEEANEFYSADTHEKMVDEIVDALEAIDCIIDFHGIERQEIQALKAKKLAEQGSYKNHILIDYVEYPAGSAEEKHCLENQDRYPELTDEDEEEQADSINSCCK